MEADGRVQIDWDKEVWNKPEWLRLFGNHPAQPATPNEQFTHKIDSPAEALSAHTPRAEINPDLEALERSYTLDIETSSPIASAPTSHARGVSPPANVASNGGAVSARVATSAPAGAAASPTVDAPDLLDPAATAVMIEELPSGYLDELPNAYFSELPKISQSRSAPTEPLEPETALSDTVEELSDAMASGPLGDETAKLANAYATALRERAAANQIEPEESDRAETTRVIDGETAKLTEIDSADLLDPETAGLSATGAARLLAGEEAASQTATEMTRLSDEDLASLEDPDLVKRSAADATQRLDTGTAGHPSDHSPAAAQSVGGRPNSGRSGDETAKVLEMDSPTNPRKFRRRASRR
jgi:hypothetical protein